MRVTEEKMVTTSKQTDPDRMKAKRRREMLRVPGAFIIDPRRPPWSRILPRWDLTVLAALFFTAIVTPFEVVFLESGAVITPLWCINRFVDVLFFLDRKLCHLHHSCNRISCTPCESQGTAAHRTQTRHLPRCAPPCASVAHWA